MLANLSSKIWNDKLSNVSFDTTHEKIISTSSANSQRWLTLKNMQNQNLGANHAARIPWRKW